MRGWAAVFGVAVILSIAPAPATAQTGRTCRQVLPSDFRRIVNTRGQEVVYFRDPVRFLCTGNVLLESDSAVVNRSASTVELIGAVVYRDSTRELRSDWANYLGGMDQLLARGSAVVRDLEGGAVVEGDQLNYLRQAQDRPVARLLVTGGRPHAILPERPRPAGGPSGADPPGDDPPGADPPGDDPPPPTDSVAPPTEVWADRMEMEGDDLFRAEGNVDLVRGAMVGGGEVALFEGAAERMTLTRSAFVENEDYRLEGDRIIAFLEGNGLREVRSEGSARVISEELNVRSERVRIGFSDGRVERLEAWNPGDEPLGPRARANTRDFRLRADSLDVLADSAGIRELRAVGRAYGERGLEEPAPGGGSSTPAALATDWIQGDTILGFFERVVTPPAEVQVGEARVSEARGGEDESGEGESAGDATEVVLERIEVVGGASPALSLYRQESEEPATRATINFKKARRIILFMEQGEVARVEAEGPLEGLYLDPSGQPAGGGDASSGVGTVDGRR